jgi:tetratricopeptide (TPR) repeat protein
MLKGSQAQLLLDEGHLEGAIGAANQTLSHFNSGQSPRDLHVHYQEALAIRGASLLQCGDVRQALADLEAARDINVRTNERLLLVDTLTYLALAYAKNGDTERALVTSEEAIRTLADIDYANYQPQRIYWHHYKILETLDRSPRLSYLQRAVEFIDAQASTLSRAQARRLRTEVRLNREILAAWQRDRLLLPQGQKAVPS